MSKFISLRKVALASLVAVSTMVAAPQAQAGNNFGGGFGNSGFGNNNFGGGFGNSGFGNNNFGGGFGNSGFGNFKPGFGSFKPGFGGGFKPGFKPGFGGFKPGFGNKFNGNFGVPPIVIPHKNHFHVVPGHFHFH